MGLKGTRRLARTGSPARFPKTFRAFWAWYLICSHAFINIFIIPLDKAGKDGALSFSTRPISRIFILAIMLEAIALKRLPASVEEAFDGRQYAFRRARGTEVHLLELTDSVQRCVEEGSISHVGNLDIEGAFDKVQHRLVVDSLVVNGVEGYLVRYMTEWFTNRSFRVRLASVSGNYYGSPRGMARGVPQVEVNSPLTWLIHFSGIFGRLEECRASCQSVFSGLHCMYVAYADDVAMVLARGDVERPATAAQR